jgi:hypothetical protein
VSDLTKTSEEWSRPARGRRGPSVVRRPGEPEPARLIRSPAAFQVLSYGCRIGASTVRVVGVTSSSTSTVTVRSDRGRGPWRGRLAVRPAAAAPLSYSKRHGVPGPKFVAVCCQCGAGPGWPRAGCRARAAGALRLPDSDRPCQ